ncbi:sensor histidine kinase [Aneurinibacillus migulanus]|uniref:Signal transduction histidine-protein kinase ArlS n=1 Tax=Aneurinibacillus migulanus TaxID=47500 RepID=A0A0D1XXF4_ANEMI|nr:ATP-binding protein [Aneurinibacillus migulanus]KIV51737.1 hypothetical protein TS65_24405 [Aneurinibacillus migulanus]KON97853.1 hypothetical protein AF333_22885 [Aneurinibacillus migulanus]MCP1353997.1 HAMP domain-containing histidine kinase [Aneurinibacillus migulanus]MED0891083.1 ATP-binding protein [Aneurinibacillus migulanus]MED1614229.1 ATP-binding protein [Aneurinibacillus migulanus]
MKINAILQAVRNRVTIKLGLLLVSVFLLIIFLIGHLLYSLFLSFYLSHIKEELIQRAQSHANVLSDHFESLTINHVIRMEKNSNQMVVILDQQRRVIASSETVTPLHRQYLSRADMKKQEETAIEQDWDTKPFLVFESPIHQDGRIVGTVMMFNSTTPIRQAVDILRGMLVIAGIVAVVIVAGVSFIISRMIVRPLLTMKKATGNIALGNYVTKVDVQGGDEIAQLAASINHMSEQIRFYQKQRNEFLADIGHELRTPLTYLKGYSEILMQSHGSSEHVEYAKTIYEQSSRLQRLVQDLFDLARMEQGTFSFQMECLSLEESVIEALSLAEISMDEKGIYLEYTPPPSSLCIMGDRQRIGQVLLNILENARRYISAGSTVFVTIEREEEYASIKIRDTGPGIPEEDIPYITERLYRVEKSRSQSTGGSGLGLAISKEIIEKHNGRLIIQSKQGEGTEFCITLPLK